MGAALLRVRAEARRAWLSWLAVAVLIGLAGGAAMAAATGARRSETAYPRFVESVRSPHVTTGGISEGGEAEFVAGLEQLKRHPDVVAWSLGASPTDQIETESGRRLSFPSLFAGVTIENPGNIGGFKRLEGRMPDPHDPHEGTVSFAAEADDLTVGSTVTLHVPDLRGGEERSYPVQVRIVGVHVAPGEFQAVNGISFPSLQLSPAFYDRYRALIDAIPPSNSLGLEMRLAPGVSVDEFREDVKRRGVLVELPLSVEEHVAGVKRTLRIETWSLWALSALLAATAIALASQALARLAVPGRDDAFALLALGMATTQLRVVAAMRALVIGVIGAGLAVVVAVIGSWFTPVGFGRLAEPDPGMKADPAVLVPGAAVVLLGVLGISVVASWRARPVGGVDGRGGVPLLSRVARPLRPAPSVGLRFALERGHGRTAVPVRAAVIGIAAGVAAVTMALTFGSSVDHLLRSPSLSGFDWDLLAAGPPAQTLLDQLADDPDVEDVTRGGMSNVAVEGERMLAFVSEGTAIQPVMLEGRAPRGDHEIALGPTTMDDLDVDIGDTVGVQAIAEDVPIDPGAALEFEVVGEAIVPVLFFEAHEPGVGGAIDYAALARIEGRRVEDVPVLARLRDGVALEAKADEVRQFAFVAVRSDQADLATLSRLTNLPSVLAGMLAVLAGGVLVHVMWSTLRRRRRDLAVLATLGFDRRQLRAAMVIQALSLTVVGVVVGLVLGVALGRQAWALFAEEIVVVSRPRVDAVDVIALLVVTVVLTAVIALVAGRRAARLHPATILATE